MVDTVFEALVDDKSYLETCNFLRSHAIRHDQQNKEKNARQVNNTSQSPGATKKDKIKTVLALINESQLQDSAGSNKKRNRHSIVSKDCIGVQGSTSASGNLDDSFLRSKEMALSELRLD
jgi:hypothetical protein